MRNTLLTATFLVPIIAIGPAFAQDIGVSVDVDISASGIDAGVDAGAEGGVGDMEPTAEVTIGAEAGGDVTLTTGELIDAMVYTNDDVALGTVVGVAVGDDGDTVLIIARADGEGRVSVRLAQAQLTADGTIRIEHSEADFEAATEVTIGAEAGGEVTLAIGDLIDAMVYTNDDVALGTVVDVAVGDDGATVLIIARADGEGRVRIRIDQAQQTADGNIRVNYSDAEIRQRIAAEAEARVGDQVCFFEDADFQGQGFCVGVGANFADMPDGWNDRVSSIRIAAGAVAQVCLNAGYTGGCLSFTADVATLTNGWNDNISSFRTR